MESLTGFSSMAWACLLLDRILFKACRDGAASDGSMLYVVIMLSYTYYAYCIIHMPHCMQCMIRSLYTLVRYVHVQVSTSICCSMYSMAYMACIAYLRGDMSSVACICCSMCTISAMIVSSS